MSAASQFHVSPTHQPLFREIGLDGESVFTDERIKVWRSLPDRENCTLDERLADGRVIRLHIKRYPGGGRGSSLLRTPAGLEVAGYRLLAENGIPAAPLIAHGRLADGRNFVILQDLSGYTPADKLVERGTPFEALLEATARVAAKLHAAGLHHRDLYLCHFMASDEQVPVDIQLIDTARVARLNNLLTRKRWIVKDLAQFWYSTTKLNVTDEQRRRWLEVYADARQIASGPILKAIERKVQSIARHDVRLNEKQPRRNISLPK